MSWPSRMFNSSLGSKYVMAITGLCLYIFLIAHLAGNILIFKGPEAVNGYALGLREMPYGALWIARIGLTIMFALHIIFAYKLNLHNYGARPQKYVMKRFQRASWPSRYMVLTGTLVLAFLFYHLAHYTWNIVAYTGPHVDPQGHEDVYTMVILGFQQPLISITYIIAMIILGLHLHHGLSSMFQSVGMNHSRYNWLLGKIGPVFGWAIAIGNISIPLSIWLGFIK